MNSIVDVITMMMTGVALAIDASIVSVTCGMNCKNLKALKQTTITAGIAFGTFQTGMTFSGWLIGGTFRGLITHIAPWIAFIILAAVGGKMIKDSFEEESEPIVLDNFKMIIILATATSIDALAVGVSYAFIGMSLYTISIGAVMIGIITCILSAIGVWLGLRFQHSFPHKEKLNMIGGIILIGIGIKALVEYGIG